MSIDAKIQELYESSMLDNQIAIAKTQHQIEIDIQIADV
jgi:hypothetical protein